MSLRRVTTGIAFAVAILVHLALGLAGAQEALCICSTGVATQQHGVGCCDEPMGISIGTEPDAQCSDCFLIPLPDGKTESIGVPSSSVLASSLPDSILIATIPWPPLGAQRPARLRWCPPGLLPQVLRSVMLTC